eukprot:1357291-Pyramimonas_sp.AAC.1
MTDSRIKGLRAALAHASLGTAKGRSRTLEFVLFSNPATDLEYQANILPLIAWSRAAREGWAAAETMRACFFGGPDGPFLRLAWCPRACWGCCAHPEAAGVGGPQLAPVAHQRQEGGRRLGSWEE